jgi:aquaporin NIP
MRSFSQVAAEVLGTFCVVFAGTGAIVANESSGGTVTHVGISLVFGLVVLAMIYAFGDRSGAHLNPAVTLGFWIAGRFPAKGVLPYISAQIAGAMIASSLLRAIFPDTASLGETLPSGSSLQSLLLEGTLTFILMLVILAVSSGAKEKGVMAGVAIGSVIGLEALFAGPISGASMNPARSLAPALINGHLDELWIYFVGPIAGASIAVWVARLVEIGPDVATADSESDSHSRKAHA